MNDINGRTRKKRAQRRGNGQRKESETKFS